MRRMNRGRVALALGAAVAVAATGALAVRAAAAPVTPTPAASLALPHRPGDGGQLAFHPAALYPRSVAGNETATVGAVVSTDQVRDAGALIDMVSAWASTRNVWEPSPRPE